MNNAQEIKALKSVTGTNDAYANRVHWSVAAEAENFVSPPYRNGHRAADWFIRVAEALVDQRFASSLPNKHSFTMDDVIRVVEKAIEDANIDHHEWWADDPEGFVKANPRDLVNELGPVNHPWGDAEVAILRGWLKVHPYRIFAVYDAVRTATQEVMEDFLLDMATEVEGGSSIEDVAAKTFVAEVAKLTKELAA
jgi:hypothetical protein